MERNAKVARVHRVLSWLYGLIAAAFLLAIFVGPSSFRERDSISATLIVLLFWGGLFLLHHLTAQGARDKKPWARTVSRVIAFLMLFGFPLGTVIGLYLLSNASKPWVKNGLTSA